MIPVIIFGDTIVVQLLILNAVTKKHYLVPFFVL